ncbi:MAG: type II/IV secretion system protein [Symploca sp. SIO2E6]|nr:type II/IV secretion system protein [Symploca sp. SIO2E6]
MKESVWQQLIRNEITCEEALQLLVDEQGNVNMSLFDTGVNKRFRKSFPKNYDFPPVIPLLHWQARYYLGSPKALSPKQISQLHQYTKKHVGKSFDNPPQIIPITEKSYRDCLFKLQIDIDLVNPFKNIRLFEGKEAQEDIRNFVKIHLLAKKDQSERLTLLLAAAIHRRASDVHLEPTEGGLRVRYRIDGILQDIIKPDEGLDSKIIGALKAKANMNIAERRLPQDGRLKLQYETTEDRDIGLDIRVNTYPVVNRETSIVHGENTFENRETAVIRLLPQKNPFSTIEHLGFTEPARKIYNGWLAQPWGLIIITGPTGSGKTSTLYTSLQRVADESKKAITIEDPVEYTLPGISQGQVNKAAGMTFAAGLRAILRQDPDIIMVGEIRDQETAETAVDAALTGHLVFTTLHTNDAVSAIPRLQSLGLDSSLISDALLGIVSQRLVRKICPHCKESYEPEEKDLHYLGLKREEAQSEKWQKGRGCSQCLNTGYFGREALIELLNAEPKMVKQLIRDNQMTKMQAYLQEIEFDSFRLAAIDKIIQGKTTVEELRRVIPYSSIRKSDAKSELPHPDYN